MRFIETSLPPGYALREFWDNAHRRVMVRWESRATDDWPEGAGFDKRADAHRSAWRHWTAKVLRGRGIEWEVHNGPPRVLYAGTGRAGIERVGDKASVLTSTGPMSELRLGRSDDIDEAMARFAALVLALEGPA